MTAAEVRDDTLAEVMEEVRVVILRCANDNGGGYSYACTAGFWRLGLEPMPAQDTTVLYATARGLPEGSVVRTDEYDRTRLWVVAKREIYPTLLAGVDGSRARAATEATVVYRAPWREPVYTGPNQFVHAVWRLARAWREEYAWCEAVECALEDAGFSDPGDRPDTPPQPQPQLRIADTPTGLVPVPLPVGYRVNGFVNEAQRAAFAGLPDGSTVSAPGLTPRVKQGDHWLYVTTLRRDHQFYQFRSLEVTHVPTH